LGAQAGRGARPAAALWVSRVSGAAMVIIALVLLGGQLPR
jgi:hypothetical protein